MLVTLGYHWVKTAYGLWLPGDSRGHWSTAWDEQIGFIRPHMLNEGDPVRLRMARELMKHPEVKFTKEMIDVVARVIGECCSASSWDIAAGSVESTHTHLLITYSKLDIDRTTKWISQQTTKAIHRETRHQGPVWGRNDWTSYIFDVEYFNNVKRYIEKHNERRMMSARPYDWITDVIL